MPLKECNDPFPNMPAGNNYRYFNQPIEMIPGWDNNKSQILFHGKDKGLYWETVPECIDIAKCATLKESTETPGTYQIIADKQRIRPLQDLGQIEEEGDKYCADFPTEKIDIVTCIKIEGSNLVIERREVVILKNIGPAKTTCENIPLTDCETETSP